MDVTNREINKVHQVFHHEEAGILKLFLLLIGCRRMFCLLTQN